MMHRLLGVDCPQCGSESVWKDNSIVLTSNPPKHKIFCSDCGWEEFQTIASIRKLPNTFGSRPDPVNHPKHYTSGGIECIEAIKEALGEHFVGYLRGNVLKYLWRFDKKEKPLEDLEKAKWYLNYLIDYERSIDEREENL